MLRCIVYPSLALTLFVANATAQTKQAEPKCCGARDLKSDPATDSALIRVNRDRRKNSKPQSAADKARTDSTLAAIRAKMDTMRAGAKKDTTTQ